MKLFYLNQELDNTKEQNILSTNEFGFKITINYGVDSWMSQHEGKQVVETVHNFTQVHYLFETLRGDDKIAFESDIRSTGFCRNIEDIERVYIELETKIIK